jgi:hypothetical protein
MSIIFDGITLSKAYSNKCNSRPVRDVARHDTFPCSVMFITKGTHIPSPYMASTTRSRQGMIRTTRAVRLRFIPATGLCPLHTCQKMAILAYGEADRTATRALLVRLPHPMVG